MSEGMDEITNRQLRAATWAKIVVVCKELEKIAGLSYFEGTFSYGTGESNPNKDFDPCVLTVGKISFGNKGITLMNEALNERWHEAR